MFRSRIQVTSAAILSVAALALTAMAVSLVGTAAASPSAATARAKPAKIKLRSTSRGKVLVSNKGFTLYAFTRDKKNKDKCVAIKHCEGVWPLITSHGKPKAGNGVKGSMLGTIKVHGRMQVTYNGHPLYGYIGDTSPGQTNYVGVSQFGGRWPAVNAKGKLVG
jgi:predicted lipoprotein with Yx(FWY)xxD motif